MKTTYDFKDVYLKPLLSSLNSREEVDLSVRLSEEVKLQIPIIASPMKGIISPAIVSGLSNLGGIGIIHRFQNQDEMMKDIRNSLLGMHVDPPYFGVAIGLDDDRYKKALDYGCMIICVDVANGYLDCVHKFCEEVADYIQTYSYDCLLMAGNVVSYDGCNALTNAGVNMIRVGIGTGALCKTREVTGIGVGQIDALIDCDHYGRAKNTLLVADGGMKTSGDIVKAFAAGADLVMLGSSLGKAFESSHNGLIYGMASRRLQEEYYHSVKSVEGIEQEIEKDTSLNSFISELVYGIKSACTYLNARNIKQLWENAVFTEIK